MKCSRIAEKYEQQIQSVVDAQVNENREAIFFIYEDGSTTDLFKGESTQISLSREQEAAIMSNGNLIGSVHSHPSGADPSTIDVMTGIMTRQESMCVAIPTHDDDISSDFVLTCLDLSNLTFAQRRRLMRAMRRSSTGVSELGREFRKQAALQRFNVTGCRTHEVEVDGVEFPASERPSAINVQIGRETGVSEIEEDVDALK